MDGVKVPIVTYNESSVKSGILEAVDSSSQSPVIANVAFQSDISGNTLTINTTSKLFQKITSGEIYASVFLVEHDVTHTTDGHVILDHSVLRAVAGTKTTVLGGYLWMDKIFNADAMVGATQNHDFEVSLNSNWVQKNLEIIVVLWFIDGDTVFALNCQNVSADLVKIKNINDIQKHNLNDFFLVNVCGKMRISFPENNNAEKKVKIFRANGTLVLEKLYSWSKLYVTIDTDKFSNGTYIVTSKIGKETYSERLLIINE